MRSSVNQETVLLYLDTLEAAGRSLRTISDYRSRLFPFIARLNGSPTDLDVRDFLDRYPSVTNKCVHLVVLRQYFKFLINRGLLDKDPSRGIPMPKARRRNYPPVSEEDFQGLQEALGQEMRVMAVVLYRVGCRVSETMNIRVEHVSFEGEYGTIEFPHRKGEVDGFAAFGPEVGTVLKPYLVGKRGPLFTFPRRQAIYWALRRAGKKAGIPGIVTPHRLRHMFIQWAVDHQWQQLALQQQLGHRSPLSTAWYYKSTRKGLMAAYRRTQEKD